MAPVALNEIYFTENSLNNFQIKIDNDNSTNTTKELVKTKASLETIRTQMAAAGKTAANAMKSLKFKINQLTSDNSELTSENKETEEKLEDQREILDKVNQQMNQQKISQNKLRKTVNDHTGTIKKLHVTLKDLRGNFQLNYKYF